jgi:hypothetical protein
MLLVFGMEKERRCSLDNALAGGGLRNLYNDVAGKYGTMR